MKPGVKDGVKQGVKRFALLLMLAWGAAGAAPFSHKLHLGLKLECVTCHTAAASSTKVSDNLLPEKMACTGCHKDVEIPSPPASRVAFFSHAQHLKMGNIAPVIAAAIDKSTYLQPPGDIRRHLNTGNACEACHRGLRESEQVTPAAMPQMADCLVCHTEIDNPFSCEKCHAKDAQLKPASHVPGYMSIHNSGKANLDKASCVVCHGRNFRCLGCH
ncbi:MAG: cytochrome family protein [Candidatus Solibacter sp.]|nr:cytochrome family protein [Candidatus Solibacter sp.]